MHARLLLAAIAFPAFTLSAQRHGGAAPSGAAIAAASGSARLDQARARSASIDGERFDVAPAKRSGGDTILHRLRSALFLGVLDVDAAEDVGLPGRVTAYRTPVRGAWVAYAESAGQLYPAKRAIEKPDAPPVWRPAVSPSSGCWWMWVFTGVPVCS
jgi:hypothetical protein